MARGRPEQEIQRTVVDYLRLALPRALVFAVPNNERRPVPGMYAGMADLVIWVPWDGTIPDNVLRLGFIEIKAPRGKLRPEQERFRDWCREHCVPWACVRSVEDAEAALRLWGWTSRAVAGGR